MNRLYWTVQIPTNYTTFDINEDFYFSHALQSFIKTNGTPEFSLKIEMLQYE